MWDKVVKGCTPRDSWKQRLKSAARPHLISQLAGTCSQNTHNIRQQNRISAGTTEAKGKKQSRHLKEFKMLRQSVVNVGKMEILIASTETKEWGKTEIN